MAGPPPGLRLVSEPLLGPVTGAPGFRKTGVSGTGAMHVRSGFRGRRRAVVRQL